MRYEYKVYDDLGQGSLHYIEAGLNKFGLEGWELISVVPYQTAEEPHQHMRYFFRRPLPS